jgi:acyl carrier protein
LTRDEILKELNVLFRDVLDNQAVVLKESTVAREVPGWDSVAHLDLMVAVEGRFDVRFTAKEIESLANVAELLTVLGRKLA